MRSSTCTFLKQIRGTGTIQSLNRYGMISQRSILQNFHYNLPLQLHRCYSKTTVETKEFPPRSAQSDTKLEDTSNANKDEGKDSGNRNQKVDPEKAKMMQDFVFYFAITECVILGGLVWYLYVLRPRRIEEKEQNNNSIQQIENDENQRADNEDIEEEVDIHSFFDLDHPNGKINAIVIAGITMTVYLRMMLNLI